jgi:Icc-related predicted phosphoesterase
MKDILAIGDLHGKWGAINTLINKKNPDIILQCGDFGWWPQFEVNRPVLYGTHREWTLKGIKNGDTRVYFCDGNHENHEDLAKIRENNSDTNPIELYRNVFYCPRGSILELPDGRLVLFCGGADSIDKDQRIIGHDWYKEELISQTDLDRCLAAPRADIVVSHTAPKRFLDYFGLSNNEKLKDPSTVALNEILAVHNPALWFFGHWHREFKGTYTGEGLNTQFYGLDYPGHGYGRWWIEIDA